MVDGLDGSGKGTILEGFRNWAEQNKLNVFDLRSYCQKHTELPEIEELKEYDVILSAEPTYSFVGRAIRFELIKNSDKRMYSGTTSAQAYALDREILYQKVIIPALRRKMIVFQERGVISSLVYQPIQNELVLEGEILHLPGNKLALKHAPDLLIISITEPEEALSRTRQRPKQDNAIFETLDFLKKSKERYTSDWLRELFERNGSKVIYLDTSSPKTAKDTQEEAIALFTSFNRMQKVL